MKKSRNPLDKGRDLWYNMYVIKRKGNIKPMMKVTTNFDVTHPDFFNREHKRNRFNTRRSVYNCGGYALGIYVWYQFEDYLSIVWDVGVEEMTRLCVEALLHDFPTLRIISDLHELQKNERAIAFRLCERDFHFMMRHKNGHWSHKPGRMPIRSITKAEVFNPEGWELSHTYDGPLVLFAMGE